MYIQAELIQVVIDVIVKNCRHKNFVQKRTYRYSHFKENRRRVHFLDNYPHIILMVGISDEKQINQYLSDVNKL